MGTIRHRHATDPGRRGRVGAELLRVEAEPGGVRAAHPAPPLAPAEDSRLHHRGERAAGRRLRHLLPGRGAVNGDHPEPPSAGPDDRADDTNDVEPGSAQDRTDLAWTRSSIAFLALGIAILKFPPMVGIPVLAIGLVVSLVALLPPPSPPDPTPPLPPPSPPHSPHT